MSTVREALTYGAGFLDAKGVSTPEVDAEWMLSGLLGVSRADLAASPGRELTPEQDARFEELVERRGTREPLAYILGEWGFRRLTLKVDRRVLVPRPETETVVERCVALLEGVEAPAVLDVGTGSGAIALSIADEHRGARVVATDVSESALAVAAENRRLAGLDDRVELVLGHWSAHVHGPFDLVVSNPPYVTPEEYPELEPEVRFYEPYEAVVGQGAAHAVARRALALLRPGGRLVLEINEAHGEQVAAELRALGFDEVAVRPDLAGRDRVVEARRP